MARVGTRNFDMSYRCNGVITTLGLSVVVVMTEAVPPPVITLSTGVRGGAGPHH